MQSCAPMGANAIEITGLKKTYASRKGTFNALDGLDVEVPSGGVYGFLGANGAGKTTAIRAIVGLLHATSGSISMLGAAIPTGLPSVIDRVGALVETPSFFPNFSGRKNLDLLARSRGFGTENVERALEQVGLTERQGDRVSRYSLGMRQRLGVAAVLLKDPEILILDEPGNGLDPPGIVEMRNLMRRLGSEGRTVFMSSHILSEVEQTCDALTIIAKGKTIRTGTVAEILAGGVSRYSVKVAGDAQTQANAATRLRETGFAVQPGEHDNGIIDVAPERAHEVTKALADVGIYVSELTPHGRTLEEAFVELTRGVQPTDQFGAAL